MEFEVTKWTTEGLICCEYFRVFFSYFFAEVGEVMRFHLISTIWNWFLAPKKEKKRWNFIGSKMERCDVNLNTMKFGFDSLPSENIFLDFCALSFVGQSKWDSFIRCWRRRRRCLFHYFIIVSFDFRIASINRHTIWMKLPILARLSIYRKRMCVCTHGLNRAKSTIGKEMNEWKKRRQSIIVCRLVRFRLTQNSQCEQQYFFRKRHIVCASCQLTNRHESKQKNNKTKQQYSFGRDMRVAIRTHIARFVLIDRTKWALNKVNER